MVRFSPPLQTALPDRLVLIIEGLRRAVSARGPTAGEALPLIFLAWWRLGGLAARFVAPVAAVKAGRLRAPGCVRRRAAPGRGAPSYLPALPPPPYRLPRGLGWLIGLVPETAQLAGPVRQFLDDPEVKALLEEAPQAGRILRPLCRMLAIELPPELRLPPRKQAVADAGMPDAPQAPAPKAGAEAWPASPELARLSDFELARRIVAAADPPLVLPRGRPQPV